MAPRRTRRLALVAAAMAMSLLLSGVIYGWSAMEVRAVAPLCAKLACSLHRALAPSDPRS